MLDFTSACYEGSLATIFTASPEPGEDVSEQVRAVLRRMDERFRCGEKPQPGHSPMLGKLAFIEGEPAPAVLATLSGTLTGLFDVVCAKGPDGDYVVTSTRVRTNGFKVGDRIPANEIHLHHDRDVWK